MAWGGVLVQVGESLLVQPQATSRHLPAATTCTRTLWLPDVGGDARLLESKLQEAMQQAVFAEE